MTVSDQRFGTFKFTGVLPAEHGSIPFSHLGSLTPRGMNLICYLEKGHAYTPGNHPYQCMVIVLEGRGRFRRGSEVREYMPGSCFYINTEMFHGFVQIDEPTVFIKHVREPLRG